MATHEVPPGACVTAQPELDFPVLEDVATEEEGPDALLEGAKTQSVAFRVVTFKICSIEVRASLDAISKVGVGPPEHFTDWLASFSSASSFIARVGLYSLAQGSYVVFAIE